ncbi:MAG: chemotaxis protein CheW, partial [Acidobacteria bacterium]|nr:chemotaxis protein CheW [Acidobacteriota bacterium]MDW7985298.1 chemotaxis protein CheW [Acidobacteriota bacterium]
MKLMGFQYQYSPRRYAIDLQRVYRILDRPNVYRVPWSRPALQGICLFDRWVIPVIDLREPLGEVQGGVTGT